MMDLEQMAVNLSLAMESMSKVSGVISIYNNTGLDGRNKVQVNSRFFKKTFVAYEVIHRKSFECPMEVRAVLNGITFFSIMSEKEYKAVYPNVG